MIRDIAYDEFEGVYSERVLADFPSMERRPLSSIRRLYEKGQYRCLVLMEEERVAAYATFIHDASIDSVLLDYFAVDESQRGSGIGSRFLAMLPPQWPGKRGILLECELPDAAQDDAQRTVRERRIRFYERGGACIVPVSLRSFGVDYSLLWLPTSPDNAATDPEGALRALYGLSLPGFMLGLFVKTKAWEDGDFHGTI